MSRNLVQLLIKELRAAVAARIAAGADPDEIAAELIRRLHRLTRMQEAFVVFGPTPPNGPSSIGVNGHTIRIDFPDGLDGAAGRGI